MRFVLPAPHLYIQSYYFHRIWMFGKRYPKIFLFHCRLNCHYANCSTPYPSFSCKFMTSNGSVLAHATNEHCRYILQNHRVHHFNTTTHYRCTLTRKNRREEKYITINYSVCRGKSKWKPRFKKGKIFSQRKNSIISVPPSPDCIKPCHNTLGLLMHQGPSALWPVVFLSLWRIFSADNQTWGKKGWNTDQQQCVHDT